ncbi:MAG: hypothetical protein GVY20_13890, partial [Bacteroidetes bacterium]|nr:hypothetical protein [Bacteroidota bacterium]
MNKVQVNFRIPESLSDALDEKAEETGKTKTSLLCDALASYLNIDTDTPDLSDIVKRLDRLERKFEDTQKKEVESTVKDSQSTKKEVDPDKLGELITMDEMASLTGYSKSTLSSKLSRESISAVKRIDGNRAG